MTIIKEFSPTMTKQEIEEWYYRAEETIDEYRDIICHFETKIENLEKKIENLEKIKDTLSTQSPPKTEEFKVGWVYSNGYGEHYLILHIWEDGRVGPIIASPVHYKEAGMLFCFSLNGHSPHNRECDYNLNVETGKPFKEDEIT